MRTPACDTRAVIALALAAVGCAGHARPTAACPAYPGTDAATSATTGAIAVEVWEMPAAHYGSFVALIPVPLGIGTLTLVDGSSVQGFVCEALATQGAHDITHLGGWRAYIASLKASPSH